MKVSPAQYIGGDFSIDRIGTPAVNGSGWFESRPEPAILFSTGRFAMLSALQALAASGRVVLLPDYLCEAQVHILQQHRIDFEFYSVGLDLRPQFSDLRRWRSRPCAMVVINYFGLVDLESLGRELKLEFPDFALVADCVQAPMTLPSTLNYDFIFTSLRKFIAVPDGAELYEKVKVAAEPQREPPGEFLNLKVRAAELKGQYLAQNIASERTEKDFLGFFAEGERALDATVETCAPSKTSRQILAEVDPDLIRARRRENYDFLASELREAGIDVPSLATDVVPLCLPMQLSQRDDLRQELRTNGVFCPVHWPSFGRLPENARGVELAKTEIGLVVDQRYTKLDMIRQLKVVKRFLSGAGKSDLRFLLNK